MLFGSGYGHRVTDGSLTNIKANRFNLMIETIKLFDLGKMRASIDQILARNEELQRALAHSLFDMCNTSLKVVKLYSGCLEVSSKACFFLSLHGCMLAD